jgi:hypothetical protein
MRKPIQPIEGYIHKFRLDSHESVAIVQLPAGKSVHGGWVLTKFAVSTLVLSALLSAVAWAFGA